MRLCCSLIIFHRGRVASAEQRRLGANLTNSQQSLPSASIPPIISPSSSYSLCTTAFSSVTTRSFQSSTSIMCCWQTEADTDCPPSADSSVAASVYFLLTDLRLEREAELMLLVIVRSAASPHPYLCWCCSACGGSPWPAPRCCPSAALLPPRTASAPSPARPCARSSPAAAATRTAASAPLPVASGSPAGRSSPPPTDSRVGYFDVEQFDEVGGLAEGDLLHLVLVLQLLHRLDFAYGRGFVIGQVAVHSSQIQTSCTHNFINMSEIVPELPPQPDTTLPHEPSPSPQPPPSRQSNTDQLRNDSLMESVHKYNNRSFQGNPDVPAESPFIRPLKPKIYHFFTPQPAQLPHDFQVIDGPQFKSFHIQTTSRVNTYFKPTLHNKKIMEEPKLYLSMERKKIKTANAVARRATTLKPSRNSYRGSKVKSVTSRVAVAQQQVPRQPKDKRIQPKEIVLPEPPKVRQPNMHFNLNHMLKKRRTFDGAYRLDENIQGSNFPYYQYYSSGRSSIPLSARSATRQSHSRQRYQLAKTVDLKTPGTPFKFN